MNPKFIAMYAVAAGIILGGSVISLVEMASPHTPPAGMNVNDAEKLGGWIATLPASAFLILLLAYFLGSAVGGWVANLLAAKSHYRPALIVGFWLFVAGIMNLIAIPHPLWFSILSSLIYFAGAWVGGRMVARAKI
jgi:hypothetical protein